MASPGTATEYTYEPEPNLADEILAELFGACEPARPAESLRIGEAPADKEFLYIFDFGDEWHFGIKLRRTSDILELGVRYPRVVARHGESPPQYPELQDDLDGDEDRSS